MGARLVTTARWGLRFMSMSWKELSSTTARSVSFICRVRGSRGVPMLPPSQTVFPSAFSISEISVVVVVLPSEPVTPMIGQGQTSKNASISEVTSAPRLRSVSMAGLLGCIPGVRNRISASTPSR